MECPHCKHEAPPAALVKCSHCGKTYERQLLEEYEHIGYLMQWLDEHRVQVGKSAKASAQNWSRAKQSLNCKCTW